MSEKRLAGDSYGAYDCSMIVAAGTVLFRRKISVLLSEVERSDLISYLAKHLNGCVLVQGTGCHSKTLLKECERFGAHGAPYGAAGKVGCRVRRAHHFELIRER